MIGSVPFDGRDAHDIQTCYPFSSHSSIISVIGFAVSCSASAFHLSLVPVLIIMPYLIHRETGGRILLVCDKQKRYAQYLRVRQHPV